MLYEIYCDKFKQKRIQFHKGLNVVQGREDNGDNSVGKSSMLRAIDFAFGGMCYADDKATIAEVGDIEIKFTFQFDKLYKFSRWTKSPKKVSVLDENGRLVEVCDVEKFHTFLLEKYNLNKNGNTIQEIIGMFFRMWGQDSFNVKKPLLVGKSDTPEPLVKVFNLFAELYLLQNEIENEKKIVDTKLAEFQGVTFISDAKYVKNIESIRSKSFELEKLELYGSNELQDPAQVIAEMNEKYNELRRQRNLLWRKYYEIKEIEKLHLPASEEEFAALHEYFPNCELKHIQEIEQFHKKLSQILQADFSADKQSLRKQIDVIQAEMDAVTYPQQISKELMQNYAILYSQINTLKSENDLYNIKMENCAKLSDLQDQFNSLLVSICQRVESTLNKALYELHSYVCESRTAYPPELRIQNPTKYTYENKHNNGDGTEYCNLVIFDLACMRSTNIPVIAHDLPFAEIEQKKTNRLVKLYDAELEKQIFITFDKIRDNYSNETKAIIRNRTVIHLTSENLLYGTVWGDKQGQIDLLGDLR